MPVKSSSPPAEERRTFLQLLIPGESEPRPESQAGCRLVTVVLDTWKDMVESRHTVVFYRSLLGRVKMDEYVAALRTFRPAPRQSDEGNVLWATDLLVTVNLEDFSTGEEDDPALIPFRGPLGEPTTIEELAAAFRRRPPAPPDPDVVLDLPDDIY